MSTREDVERHVASLGDDALVRLVEFEQHDYEPIAFEIAKDELARRCLPQVQLAHLRSEAKAAVRLEMFEGSPELQEYNAQKASIAGPLAVIKAAVKVVFLLFATIGFLSRC